MSDKLDQDRTFACCNNETCLQKCISKRFYAACAAMQGGMIEYLRQDSSVEYSYEDFVSDCYIVADELLKQEED